MSKLSLRHLLASVFILALIVVLSLAGCSQSSSTNTTFISSLEGDVQIKKAGTADWTKVKVKSDIEVSDSIKTGANSKIVITFFDGSTIELKSNTQVEIRELV